jgi:hypothetical protein
VAKYEQAVAAKAKVRTELEPIAELRGVGIAPSPDGFHVKVNLSKPIPVDLAEVDGVPIEYEVVGDVRAYDDAEVAPTSEP